MGICIGMGGIAIGTPVCAGFCDMGIIDIIGKLNRESYGGTDIFYWGYSFNFLSLHGKKITNDSIPRVKQ